MKCGQSLRQDVQITETPEQLYREAYDEMMSEPLDDPSSAWRWAIWFSLTVIVISCILIWRFPPVSAAKAHDWYPPNCCSGHDCRRISDSLIELRQGGFYVRESRETISYSDDRVKRTPPEGGSFYHRCSKGGAADGETICLYVPNFGA